MRALCGSTAATLTLLAVIVRDFADICGRFECTRVTNWQASSGTKRMDILERNAKCTVIDDQFGYVSVG